MSKKILPRFPSLLSTLLENSLVVVSSMTISASCMVNFLFLFAGFTFPSDKQYLNILCAKSFQFLLCRISCNFKKSESIYKIKFFLKQLNKDY